MLPWDKFNWGLILLIFIVSFLLFSILLSLSVYMCICMYVLLNENLVGLISISLDRAIQGQYSNVLGSAAYYCFKFKKFKLN